MSLTLEDLASRITTGTVDTRVDALDELRAAVRQKQILPLDEILTLLRDRGGVGPHREKSHKVREAIHHAKRAVAVARGRQRGLRGPAPALAGLTDSDLVWASIVFVWDAVSIYDGLDILQAGLSLATERQRHFYAVWWTTSELANGGFHQYFYNTTGVIAPVALQAFESLGEGRAVTAVREAVSHFDLKQIADHAYRRRVLGELPAASFARPDDMYHAAAPQVFRLAAEYVRAHPDEFFE